MVEHQYPNSPHPIRQYDDMSKGAPQHQSSHSLQCSEQLTLLTSTEMGLPDQCPHTEEGHQI